MTSYDVTWYHTYDTKHHKICTFDCTITFSTLFVSIGIIICVTNFIQLISPQPVDRFSQTKLLWKALNEGYPHICGMYKSNNEQLRYQAISSCKSFVC